ncbi:hypothetical protein [Jatrophihabitans endophyticus]|uniref:hypothetical protein n=1 Tax=Jatrophihabitans endophyticus TaxID=1206085 RepID=UPI0019FAB5DC|nr:hypothetical protein [Jatrophihabitans endophyticus]MBE7187122.1 hypothetical protein [Jatrophihabitans endophyticus]
MNVTDLDRVFASLEAEADDHLQGTGRSWVPTGRSPARRGHRVLVPGLAAAAVVAVAAVGVAVASTRHSPHHAPTGPAAVASIAPAAPRYRTMPLHELVFGIARAAGSYSQTYASAAYQSVELDTTTSAGQVFVTFHRAGGPLPFATDGARPVRVNGRPGVYARTDTLLADGPYFRGVAWRYGPHEWATVSSHDYDLRRAQALTLARSVRLDRHALRTPLRIRLAGATERDWGTSYPRTNGSTDARGFVLLRDGGHLAQASLADLPSGSRDTVTVGGRPAAWSGNHTVLTLSVGHTAVQIMAISGGRHEALRVARATSVAAEPIRVATWFDATTALP